MLKTIVGKIHPCPKVSFMLDFIQDLDIMADKILIIDDDVDTLRWSG